MLAKSLKIHLAFYLLVNVFLIGIWAVSGGGYFWPIWSILGWGIAVAAHAIPQLVNRGSPRGGGGRPANAATSSTRWRRLWARSARACGPLPRPTAL